MIQTISQERIARLFLSAVTLMAVLTLWCSACRANDLDDGIAIDEDIKKYDKINLDLNLGFIERDAISRAAIKKRNIKNLTNSDSGDVVQGGVIVKPGGKTGDITVIYKGSDNTIIND